MNFNSEIYYYIKLEIKKDRLIKHYSVLAANISFDITPPINKFEPTIDTQG